MKKKVYTERKELKLTFHHPINNRESAFQRKYNLISTLQKNPEPHNLVLIKLTLTS